MFAYAISDPPCVSADSNIMHSHHIGTTLYTEGCSCCCGRISVRRQITLCMSSVSSQCHHQVIMACHTSCSCDTLALAHQAHVKAMRTYIYLADGAGGADTACT